jgi:hypothetical protein
MRAQDHRRMLGFCAHSRPSRVSGSRVMRAERMSPMGQGVGGVSDARQAWHVIASPVEAVPSTTQPRPTCQRIDRTDANGRRSWEYRCNRNCHSDPPHVRLFAAVCRHQPETSTAHQRTLCRGSPLPSLAIPGTKVCSTASPRPCAWPIGAAARVAQEHPQPPWPQRWRHRARASRPGPASPSTREAARSPPLRRDG